MSSPAVAAWLIGAVILALYGRTLGYGLFWDDFAALRPRGGAALAGAWTGAWDPGGVWPAFYRPLSLWLYAGLHATVGMHAAWLHALTLAALGAAAWLVRAVVRADTGDATLGLAAALLLVAHPETPSSLAAWISQLFHLMPLLAVLCAIRAWQRGSGSSAAWYQTLAWLTVGVLFKEDVVMMAPALVAWQAARARAGVAGAPVTGRLIVTAGLWVAGYLAWRQAMLGEIGGYVRPEWWLAARNVLSVPLFTVALQWIPQAHGISLASGAGVAALGLSAWRARASATAGLISLGAGGAVIVAAASAPLVLIAGHTRVHLAVLGAVFLFTAALGIALRGHAAGVRLSRLTVAALLIGAAGMAGANWRNTSTFAPCSAFWRMAAADVLEWPMVSPAATAPLAARLASCGTRP